MTGKVQRLALDLEQAIDAGDVVRVLILVEASRLGRRERLDVCRLLSHRTADVVLAFDRYDEARVLTAA